MFLKCWMKSSFKESHNLLKLKKESVSALKRKWFCICNQRFFIEKNRSKKSVGQIAYQEKCAAFLEQILEWWLTTIRSIDKFNLIYLYGNKWPSWHCYGGVARDYKEKWRSWWPMRHFFTPSCWGHGSRRKQIIWEINNWLHWWYQEEQFGKWTYLQGEARHCLCLTRNWHKCP